jgi:hypothetical protein
MTKRVAFKDAQILVRSRIVEGAVAAEVTTRKSAIRLFTSAATILEHTLRADE